MSPCCFLSTMVEVRSRLNTQGWWLVCVMLFGTNCILDKVGPSVHAVLHQPYPRSQVLRSRLNTQGWSVVLECISEPTASRVLCKRLQFISWVCSKRLIFLICYYFWLISCFIVGVCMLSCLLVFKHNCALYLAQFYVAVLWGTLKCFQETKINT